MSAPRVSAHSEAARYVDSCGFCLRDGHTYVTCPYKLGTLHPEHLRLREYVEWSCADIRHTPADREDKMRKLGILVLVPMESYSRAVFAWSPLAPNPEED